ncbi:MAG: response regulator [Bacteriovorax sp.]|jgi:response regulator RpfG family c-di-GMP phosphodiesterase
METKVPRILIVDKSNGGSFVLASVLGNWKYEVFKVNSFLKAIEYAQNNHYTPDLIIVELNEPNPIFFEFPRKFKERTGKEIPMIVHTIINDKDCVHKSLTSGYVDYLIRPMEPELLKDKIANIVRPNVRLNDQTFTFHLDEDALLVSRLKLDFINEFEIEASSQFPIKPGTIVTVQSDLLKGIGFPQIDLRVDDLKKKEAEIAVPENPYKLKLSFVGLSSEDFAKIKKLSMSKVQSAAA